MVINIDTWRAAGKAFFRVQAVICYKVVGANSLLLRALFRHLEPFECPGKTPSKNGKIVLIFARIGIRIAASKNLAINNAKR